MPLTKEQRDEYLARKGLGCPFCSSSHIEGMSVDLDEGGAQQVILCNECGKSWVDVYELVDVVAEE